MPAGALHPPHSVPGLDYFLREDSGLVDVHITQSATEGLWRIDVHATHIDRSAPDGISVSLQWQPVGRSRPDMQFVRIGDLVALYAEEETDLRHLGFGALDQDTRERRLEAIHGLWSIYQQAVHIQDDYLQEASKYVVARLDSAARMRTRAPVRR